MNVRYRVTLTQYERDELDGLLSGGKSRARKLKRARRIDGLPDQAALRRRQPGTGAERRAAPRRRAQAHR